MRAFVQTPEGYTVELQGPVVTFGSAPVNDVVVPEAFGLEPVHFELRNREGDWELVATAATRVGGQGVRQQVLRQGDQLEAGELSLGFYQRPVGARRRRLLQAGLGAAGLVSLAGMMAVMAFSPGWAGVRQSLRACRAGRGRLRGKARGRRSGALG